MVKEYVYQDLSLSLERDLGLILGRVTHHIHPEIVNYIAEKNVGYETRFLDICHENCNRLPFFYTGSDCVFPGFRRPINKEKIGAWKNKVFLGDGTILNDNTFPRHIWAYLTMGKAYSGGAAGMWSASGLSRFELAHVFAHKRDERTLEREVFSEVDLDVEPYGLFTSASNIVLIPKGFAKPTDSMKSIKACFYQRHMELYGNNVIGLGELKAECVPSWSNEIDWLEPVLPIDWKVKIDYLLAYRERYLAAKYTA